MFWCWLFGCWIVSGGGYSVRVVIMMECFSGGCSRMLVVDQSPQVVMVGHNLLKFHDQIS